MMTARSASPSPTATSQPAAITTLAQQIAAVQEDQRQHAAEREPLERRLGAANARLIEIRRKPNPVEAGLPAAEQAVEAALAALEAHRVTARAFDHRLREMHESLHGLHRAHRLSRALAGQPLLPLPVPDWMQDAELQRLTARVATIRTEHDAAQARTRTTRDALLEAEHLLHQARVGRHLGSVTAKALTDAETRAAAATSAHATCERESTVLAGALAQAEQERQAQESRVRGAQVAAVTAAYRAALGPLVDAMRAVAVETERIWPLHTALVELTGHYDVLPAPWRELRVTADDSRMMAWLLAVADVEARQP